MFEFMENYRNVSIPAPEMEGVTLTCSLGSGLGDSDIPVGATGQLREFWRRTSGGLLLVDEQFGICGLTLHDPTQAKQRSRERADDGYEVNSDSDWVLGEFVGDTDMLIIDADDAVLISAGSYPRSDWYRFESLPDVLSKYVETTAEKYWELTR
ncbi:hypothetical protein A5761_27985 [Mycolicibacterium setense]|uniref:hypothetical protein n=1 Tax=Mycolicibacterium setense TaxID=431269 RepID=UPI0007EB7AED|nr:hypothetical protein [Mycolicibacterium setense]OBB10244.1 hypothetical protein A5761_27985 [Mycolicibacterium setense]